MISLARHLDPKNAISPPNRKEPGTHATAKFALDIAHISHLGRAELHQNIAWAKTNVRSHRTRCYREYCNAITFLQIELQLIHNCRNKIGDPRTIQRVFSRKIADIIPLWLRRSLKRERQEPKSEE